MPVQEAPSGDLMRALVIGSAAGGGFPQWNCACDLCADAWAGAPGLTPRTQSSLAVSADGAHYALLNASPDLRAQILATPALQPAAARAVGGRASPIVSVLLTNADLDHIAGLITLRERHPLRLFATQEVLAMLDANPVFDALDRNLVVRTPLGLGDAAEIAPGVEATLFTAPGKTPLYLEGDGPIQTDLEGEQTVGVELRWRRRRVIYLPGCAKITPALVERLEGADALFFDGTVFHDDDMIRAGVGQKTGLRMGHLPMMGPEGSLAALRDLRIGRRIFVHLNNTNPVLRPDAPERRVVEDAGWEVAFDGLEAAFDPAEEPA